MDYTLDITKSNELFGWLSRSDIDLGKVINELDNIYSGMNALKGKITDTLNTRQQLQAEIGYTNINKLGRGIPKTVEFEITPTPIYKPRIFKSKAIDWYGNTSNTNSSYYHRKYFDTTRYDLYNKSLDGVDTKSYSKRRIVDNKVFKYKMDILEFLAKEAATKNKTNGLYTIDELDKNNLLDKLLYITANEDDFDRNLLVESINDTIMHSPDLSVLTSKNLIEMIRYNQIKEIVNQSNNIDNDTKLDIWIKILKIRYLCGKSLDISYEIQNTINGFSLNPEDANDKKIFDALLGITVEDWLYILDYQEITAEYGWDNNILQYTEHLPPFDVNYNKAEQHLIGRMKYTHNQLEGTRWNDLVRAVNNKLLSLVGVWTNDSVLKMYKLPNVKINDKLTLERDIIHKGVPWGVFREIFKYLTLNADITNFTIDLKSTRILENLNLTQRQRNVIEDILSNAAEANNKSDKYNDLLNRQKYTISESVARENKTLNLKITDPSIKPSKCTNASKNGNVTSFISNNKVDVVIKNQENMNLYFRNYLTKVGNETVVDLHKIVEGYTLNMKNNTDTSGDPSKEYSSKENVHNGYIGGTNENDKISFWDSVKNYATEALKAGANELERQIVVSDQKNSELIAGSSLSALGYSIFNKFVNNNVPDNWKPTAFAMGDAVSNVWYNVESIDRINKELGEVNRKQAMLNLVDKKGLFDSVDMQLDVDNIYNHLDDKDKIRIGNLHKNEFGLSQDLSLSPIEGENKPMGNFSIKDRKITSLNLDGKLGGAHVDTTMARLQYQRYYEKKKRELELAKKELERANRRELLQGILGTKIRNTDWLGKIRNGDYKDMVMGLAEKPWDKYVAPKLNELSDKLLNMQNKLDNVISGAYNRAKEGIDKIRGLYESSKKFAADTMKTIDDAFKAASPLVSALGDVAKELPAGPVKDALTSLGTDGSKMLSQGLSSPLGQILGFSGSDSDNTAVFPASRLKFGIPRIMVSDGNGKNYKDLGIFALDRYEEIMDYMFNPATSVTEKIAKRTLSIKLPLMNIDAIKDWPINGKLIDITRYFTYDANDPEKVKGNIIDTRDYKVMDRICNTYIAKLLHVDKPEADMKDNKEVEKLREKNPNLQHMEFMTVTFSIIPIAASAASKELISDKPYISYITEEVSKEEANKQIAEQDPPTNDGILGSIADGANLTSVVQDVAKAAGSRFPNAKVPLNMIADVMVKHNGLIKGVLDKITDGKIDWNKVVKYANLGLKVYNAGMNTYNNLNHIWQNYGNMVKGLYDEFDNFGKWTKETGDYFRSLLPPLDTGSLAKNVYHPIVENNKNKLPDRIDISQNFTYDIITDFDDDPEIVYMRETILSASRATEHTKGRVLGFIGNEPNTIRGIPISVNSHTTKQATLF